MILNFKLWEDIPENMKNEYVKEYYDRLSKKRISLVFKRIFDILVSITLIVILSPLLIIISIWIKSDSAGPVLFKQKRITQYGKSFKIFKFRSMVVNSENIGTLVTISNDSRITKSGNLIRKYRLDELPQLFNILIGDMTFVGVRPEVPKYVEEYTDKMLITLLLPAGVTSEASIRFKDEEKYLKDSTDVDNTYVNEILPEKMKWNIIGIHNFGFLYDIKVLFRTLIEITR